MPVDLSINPKTIRGSSLRVLVAGAVLLLSACAEQETAVPDTALDLGADGADPRLCSTYLHDEAARLAFRESWKARIAAVSPEVEEGAIDQTVEIFDQVLLGYCQAGGEQPVPYLDESDAAFDPTMRDSLIMDFVERLNDSVEPPPP